MNMSLSKFWGLFKDREAWQAAVHGVTKIFQVKFSDQDAWLAAIVENS